MTSLVSTVIPVYNCARYVAQAIESALAQDYLAKEIVVVNDGSTDDTLAVLKRFGDRIRIVDQPNAGPPAARNAGLQAAAGDYIAFLDADDVWVQGKLSAQVRHLEAHPDVGTVYTAWREWRAAPDGSFAIPGHPDDVVGPEVDTERSGWLYNKLLLDCELLTTTVMMRRSIVTCLGNFDLMLFNGDDYDYWLRASREARITKLQSVGAHYRVLPGSVSRRPQETNFEYKVIELALTRWGLEGPDGTRSSARLIKHRLQSIALSHSYMHVTRGDPQIAYTTLRSELSRDPVNWRLWMSTVRAAVKARFSRPGSRTVG